MDVLALERCVGDVDRFRERHWGRAPLVHSEAAKRVHAFDDIASLNDLDHLVASVGLHASSVRMVRGGKAVPVSAYTDSAAKSSRLADPLVSAPLVYERFSEGATIVLESLHRYWKPLTDFCRDLEIALGHRLQTNAYITPPNSQGFDVHRDDHDVLVLQVSGAKHWVVFGRESDDVLIDQDIERGDVLYIPKGFPHAATTGRSASAHLTVGILTHDSIDVVREVVKLAEEEPLFRERLSGGGAIDPTALRKEVERNLEEMRAWLDKVDVDELTERVARRMRTTSLPVFRGQLRQLQLLETLGDQTRVARRRGATCALFGREGALRVLLADRELEMPIGAAPAMEAISRRESLRVADLHEFLTPDSSMVLVRRLVREGLLEIVDP